MLRLFLFTGRSFWQIGQIRSGPTETATRAEAFKDGSKVNKRTIKRSEPDFMRACGGSAADLLFIGKTH